MVRLTAELIHNSPAFLNCLKERELDLRGVPLTTHTPHPGLTLSASHCLSMDANGEIAHAHIAGHKIPAIENLGAAEDQFDVLDLSDNEVTHLDGFTRMPRLTSLMLNNNRVSTIAAGLSSSIPNLETLIMTNNRIENLADLDQLAELTNLHTISLLKNEVAKKNHYRHYLIFKCPSLKIIDFRKVKYQVREFVTLTQYAYV